jgi:hypothetical protein
LTAVQGEIIETRLSADSFLRLVIPSFPALFRLEFEIRIWNARRFPLVTACPDCGAVIVERERELKGVGENCGNTGAPQTQKAL